MRPVDPEETGGNARREEPDSSPSEVKQRWEGTN